jgi:adenylate kinase
MKKLILFLGLPGCGKGTQAKIIFSTLGIPSYSIGEFLRSYSNENHSDSLYVKSMLEKGEIVPGDLVNNIVKSLIDSVEKDFILDGYPRNIDQARFLDQYKSFKVMPIYFNLDRNLLVERIINRIQCKKCDTIYNAKKIDLTDFKCLSCGSLEYYKRLDDSESILKNRIQQFDSNTVAVLDFYKNLNLLYEIDAAEKVEIVSQKLNHVINDLSLTFDNN